METKMVSVSRDYEHNIAGGSGKPEVRIYLRMYVEAAHSGLLADIGPENWHTLCVIASFMDAEGRCYPSQDLIGHRLGVGRPTANRRIKKLLAYRWQDKPVILAHKQRHAGGTWDNTVYTILPISNLEIF